MRTMVSAVNQSLYEEFGLKGNQADYYNPESRMMEGVSCINLKSWPWKFWYICSFAIYLSTFERQNCSTLW